jgi:hypothetical protein
MSKFAKIIVAGFVGILLLGFVIYIYNPIRKAIYPEPTPYDLSSQSVKDLPKVNFSRSGTLREIGGSNKWNFVYTVNGETKEVSLEVTPQTVCMHKNVSVECPKIEVVDGDLVNVDGLLRSSKVEAIKIQKVN